MNSLFWIPEPNVGKLLDNLVKLQKRAKKLDCGAIVFKITGNEEFRKISKKETLKYIEFEVSGDAPVLNGWEFKGTIELDDAIGVQFRSIPGWSFPEIFKRLAADTTLRPALYTCSHCNTERFRRQTFVVADDYGNLKQVGRTCLKDFLGHKSPEAMARYCEYLSLIDEVCREHTDAGSAQDYYYDLASYFAWVSAEIRRFGWVSVAMTKDDPEKYPSSTSWGAFIHFVPPPKFERVYQLDDKDREVAQSTVAHFEAMKEDEKIFTNDYLFNCVQLTYNGLFNMKTMGIAASMVQVYLREEEKRRKLDSYKDEYFGTIGSRDHYLLYCESTRYVEPSMSSQYPTEKTQVSFRDADGRPAIWWASGSVDIAPGKWYVCKATVKRHSEYKGQKQTTLNRVNYQEAQ